MKEKIINRFSLVFIFVALIFITFEIYSMRNVAIDTAEKEATKISKVIKYSLTSHMINGTMEKRDIFLNSIMSIKEIKSLRIIRGPKVNAQFGQGRDKELPRDEIDKQVLKTGLVATNFKDAFLTDGAAMRITIPYAATKDEQIDCLSCHHVKEGDVLGAVTMVIDISNLKQSGKDFIYLIIILSIVLIFVIIKFTDIILKPYLKTFKKLGKSLTNASRGQFNPIVKPRNLTEGKDVDVLIDEYNYLMHELKKTFVDIDHKLSRFTGQTTKENSNNFIDSKNIISNLEEIYVFKKQIELDNNVTDVYERMGQILINKFHVKDFNFTIYDAENQIQHRILLEGSKTIWCDKAKEFDQCRTYKTNNDIYSVKNHNACSYFIDNKNFYHYCISFKFMDNRTLVVQLVVDSEDKFIHLKEIDIPFIKKYFEEAIPTLGVKYLVQELKESLYRDSLTGLHNRKFFDEESTMLAALALREGFNIAVLMLDMDHFKAVNDEHGHNIGDEVLKMLGKIIKTSIRESDLAIRMGGEEFLVLLINITEEDALKVADKIRTNVAQTPIKLPNGDNFYKTISTGISMYPADDKDLMQVVKNSDIALYEAKNTGRNKVIRFEDEMTSTIDLF